MCMCLSVSLSLSLSLIFFPDIFLCLIYIVFSLTHIHMYTGAGFNVVRVPMSTCDFSLSEYTFDDTPWDNALTRFSIDHDRAYIIPVLLQIQAINPGVTVVLTPWTVLPTLFCVYSLTVCVCVCVCHSHLHG